MSTIGMADEPVQDEVYRYAIQELLASQGWAYLEAALKDIRLRNLEALTRLSQDYNSRPQEIAATGAAISMIDKVLSLPHDMAYHEASKTPVAYHAPAPRGRRFIGNGRG